MLPSLNFPQLDFVEPSSGFYPVIWECVNSYLWIRVSRGVAHNLFICVVYTASIGSRHESKSLFQNLATNIAKVQTIRGIILLGGDFNARITMLPHTIDISDLCELL